MEALISKFRDIVGPEWVFTHEHQLRTYESDGLLQYQALPAVAVLPGDGDQVRDVVAACAAANVPFVPRGAGSGLSGGALAVDGGIVLSARDKERSGVQSGAGFVHRKIILGAMCVLRAASLAQTGEHS